MNRRHFLATATSAAAVYTAGAAAQSQEKWRIGVIGHTGRGNYGHGLDTMWLTLPETEIVGVADANAEGLVKAREKLKGAPGFADYRQMLAEAKPDIVAICPRHIDQHHDMALTAIEAGARGIYMEKPFCRTLLEADEVVAACENKGTKLALAHRNRYHPVLGTVDGLIKTDAIGRVLEIRGRGKEDARGGALDLWVLGSHVLNLCAYFAGTPFSCSALMLQDGRPVKRTDLREGDEGVGLIGGNELHALYETERGITVFFDSIAKAGVPSAGFGLQVIGTKGVIDLRIDKEPLAHLLEGNPFEPSADARAWVPISTAGPGKPEPIADLGKQVSSHALAARDLISAIKENREPLCSAKDGRIVNECIAAVFESHRDNGKRVTMPLSTRQNPLASL